MHLSNLNNRIANVLVRWNLEIKRRRSLTNAAARVVVRAVTRAVIAADKRPSIGNRYTPEMSTNSDDDKKISVFHSIRIRLWVAQLRDGSLLCLQYNKKKTGHN